MEPFQPGVLNVGKANSLVWRFPLRLSNAFRATKTRHGLKGLIDRDRGQPRLADQSRVRALS